MRGTVVDPQLRRILQSITDECIGDRGHDQIALIEALSHEYPHSISLVQEAILGKPESGNFTCFQYALDLIDLPDQVRLITSRFPRVFVGSDFFGWLTANILQPTGLDHAREGDLVLYLAGGRVEHAARLSADLLISKWGLGHMWRHGLFEVPEAFGGKVKCFQAFSSDAAGDAFIKYAKHVIGGDRIEQLIGPDGGCLTRRIWTPPTS